MTTTSARRPRRSRAEQVAANRRVLLDAAGEVFRKLGYGGASIDAIADRAGFTKGAVYSHFDSKADLFGASGSDLEWDSRHQPVQPRAAADPLPHRRSGRAARSGAARARRRVPSTRGNSLRTSGSVSSTPASMTRASPSKSSPT